jgi:redox-sensitive bicupin YhaK (pirin superfamily)
MQKKIEHLLAGRPKQITEEEKVLQPLPHKDFRFANPFIVLHHLGPDAIAPGGKLRIHPHPHRGFAPITFQLQGEGYHMDNAGHENIIRSGDAQWMFAGKGILHSEGPSEQLLQNGGIQELIQIWVNVPKKYKWEEPFYQSATVEQQPGILQQEGVNLRLVSGEYEGVTGPLKSFTPVLSIIGTIEKGRRVQFSAQPGYWTLLYVIKGRTNVGQESIEAHNLIVFEKENDEVIVCAEEDAQVLFLSAEPIEEPVAAKDNFVMNTQEEISQAMTDYKDGVFGSLEY